MSIMSRVSSRQRSTSRNVAGDTNAFYQPKQLTILCIWAFITAIYVARTFAAIQRAGLVEAGPNQIGSFHFHHWAIFFIVLPMFLFMGFGFHVKFGDSLLGKQLWAVCLIGVAICMGLFMDGIVYLDSAVFFEASTEIRQPLTMEDLYFMLFLGATWFGITFVLFGWMYNTYRRGRH
jgi:cation transport ATPase